MEKLFLGLGMIFFFSTTDAQVDQWRGPDRDGHFPDSALLQSWPDNGPQLILDHRRVFNQYQAVRAAAVDPFANHFVLANKGLTVVKHAPIDDLNLLQFPISH